MRVKNKKIIILLLLTGCVLSGYWFWLSLRPEEIVAVHNDGNHSNVLVRSFPLTGRGKQSFGFGFTTYDGDNYRLEQNRGMIKIKSD